MGFYPVSRVSIERVYRPDRHLLVKWFDDVLGKEMKRPFPFEAMDEAIEFAAEKLKSLSM